MNPDQSEIASIESRLKSSARKIHELAPQVGSSRQIKEFSSDRRKNLLSRYIISHLKAGESFAAAEAYARADGAFQAEFEALERQHEAAEKTIAMAKAEEASWESARSLLALQRETMKTLEG